MLDEVSIVPFKYKHLPLLHEMLKSQNYLGICYIEMKTLPKIGFIALLNNQPIAAGFLRRVEGGFAQIDTLASNAYFGSQIRHAGVSKVVDSLIEEAKHLKLRGIISVSSDTGTLKRAIDLGFKALDDQKVIVLPL